MCEEIEKMLLESSQETAVKIAMHMLSSGKLTLEEIAYFTDLSIHELKKSEYIMTPHVHRRYNVSWGVLLYQFQCYMFYVFL